jgi:hypothetical protein
MGIARKPTIGEMKTIAVIQTNVQKLSYGYSKAGAGFLDRYQDFKTVRGKFEQLKATRSLESGAVLPVSRYRFTFRFDTEISNVLNQQLRLVIYGKTYTLESDEILVYGRNDFFVFNISEYNRK